MEAIIFCGIQATGKTTFFKQQFFKTHLRISLDQLKTRNRENIFMDACFKTSQPFVIDNTNPTKLERQKYISIAKENKFKIIGFYFQSKILVSLERNKQRQGTDFIKEIGIKGTFNKLQVPTIDEGFDKLFYVEIEDNNFLIKEWTNEI